MTKTPDTVPEGSPEAKAFATRQRLADAPPPDRQVQRISDRVDAYLAEGLSGPAIGEAVHAEAIHRVADAIESVVHILNTGIDPDLIASRFRQTVKILENLAKADEKHHSADAEDQLATAIDEMSRHEMALATSNKGERS